jgi:phytoene dehydrogenase-like protein
MTTATGSGGSDYDAVVIGAGHHGTLIACYLAKAGLKVGVFEAHTQLGGGAGSEEGPAPGFRQDFCAHLIRFYSHPANKDFDLASHGLEYLFPEQYAGSAQEVGAIFDDHTSFIGYAAHRVVDPKNPSPTDYAPANVQKTYDQIARFSTHDADAYMRYVEAYRTHWRPALSKYKYSTPPPYGTPDALEELLNVEGSLLEPVHMVMSLSQLAKEFFDSDELRTIFMREAATSAGCYADDTIGLEGLLHFLVSSLSLEPTALAKGGTQAITDALVSAGRSMGAEYFTGAEVTKVTVESGKAAGVELADGSKIRARIVVSDLGIPQTYLRLLEGAGISDRIKRRIKNISYDRSQILWGNIAVHEFPEYIAEKDNPGIGRQPRLYTGAADAEYMTTKYPHDIFVLGFPQELHVMATADSIWDPSRVPEGKHTFLVEEFCAPARLFSPSEWTRLKEDFTQQWLEKWRSLAPNMTRDNVISSRLYSPYDVEQTHPDMIDGGWTEGSQIASQIGRFRPLPDLANYRTHMPNLYICSSNLHSGGGLGQSSSVNAFNLIAEDHGLK